jgi:hypothetical protein
MTEKVSSLRSTELLSEVQPKERTPLCLKVGAIGHRYIEHTDTLREAFPKIRNLLQSVFPHVNLLSCKFKVLTSLAEGADRILARYFMDQYEAELEVYLPLVRAEFEKDFKGSRSVREFRTFLHSASGIWIPSSPLPRHEAYEVAARELVNHSNTVVAIWDGHPARGSGGTADTVSYARKRQIPVIIINPQTGEVVRQS